MTTNSRRRINSRRRTNSRVSRPCWHSGYKTSSAKVDFQANL